MKYRKVVIAEKLNLRIAFEEDVLHTDNIIIIKNLQYKKITIPTFR